MDCNREMEVKNLKYLFLVPMIFIVACAQVPSLPSVFIGMS